MLDSRREGVIRFVCWRQDVIDIDLDFISLLLLIFVIRGRVDHVCQSDFICLNLILRFKFLSHGPEIVNESLVLKIFKLDSLLNHSVGGFLGNWRELLLCIYHHARGNAMIQGRFALFQTAFLL